MIRRSFRPLLAVVASLVVGLAACSADRSGTLTQLPQTGASVTPCAPEVAKDSTVAWQNTTTGSVILEYVKGSTTVKSSTKNVATAASSGSVVIATPAAALGGGWSISAINLYPRANAKGTKVRVPTDCANAVPPATEVPITETPATTALVTTTLPCTTAPINTAPPTIVNDPNSSTFLILGSEGSWSSVTNCATIATTYRWERSFSGGAWGSYNTDGTVTFSDCYARYRLIVTKTNEFGSMEAVSAAVNGRC